MRGMVVTQGKSIEEAVRKAARQLQVETGQVEFEIIDKGQRGIFRARPAVIRATVKEKQRAEQLVSATDKELLDKSAASKALEGTAWVENGKVYCRNGAYSFPLVSSGEGLTLKINGQPVTGFAIVTEEDQIEVEVHKEEIESQISLTVAADGMNVKLEVTPGSYTIRHITDQKPSRELILETSATTIPKIDITEYGIHEKLTELGVKFGIDHDAIKNACTAQETATYVVAKGTEPIQGVNGKFEFFQQKRKTERDQFTISDTIDWKDRFSLPTVQVGEIIGRALPAEQGSSGRNVFGEEVLPAEVQELAVMTLEGTALHGTDQKVVATRAGRLKIEKRIGHTLCFSILPQYVHNGNVNMHTGNIKFHGDVFIIGNVEEGLAVEAGGNLHITGTVTNATVRTGGDAVVNGAVVGSAIICGDSNLFWDQMLPLFKTVHNDLDKLLVAMRQLESNRSFSKTDLGKKGLQPLLRLLVDAKFKELPQRIREISQFMKNKKPQISENTYQAIDFLEKTFLYFHPLVKERKQLETVTDYLQQAISNAEHNSNKKMNIQVQSLTNSSIQSAWDVVIERFCYGSEVYCKGSMQIRDALRGGKVAAGGHVKANEIGSNGSRTEVAVSSKEGFVQAAVAWPDTMFKIAGVAKKLINQESSIRVHLNKQNQIVLR